MELANVSSRFGAPMGRARRIGPVQEEHGEILCTFRKLEFIDGDYDAGGAYWGCGADGEGHILMVTSVENDDWGEGELIEVYERMESRWPENITEVVAERVRHVACLTAPQHAGRIVVSPTYLGGHDPGELIDGLLSSIITSQGLDSGGWFNSGGCKAEDRLHLRNVITDWLRESDEWVRHYISEGATYYEVGEEMANYMEEGDWGDTDLRRVDPPDFTICPVDDMSFTLEIAGLPATPTEK
jgi:hypothetical protein